jgi:hypothetical protein
MNATCGAVGAGSEDPLECGHHLVNFKRRIGEHGVSRSPAAYDRKTLATEQTSVLPIVIPN